MGYDANPNGSDFTIVTDVLQYSVFTTEYDRFESMFLELLWSPWKATSPTWPS